MSLTRKQQVFVQEYPQCWNASEAARRAGYSTKTAGSIGQRLLKEVEIAAAINRLTAEKTIKAGEVLELLTAQGQSNLAEFFTVAERWSAAPLPWETPVAEKQEVDPATGAVRTLYLVRHLALDERKLFDPRYGRLVKELHISPARGLTIRLHDAQNALIKLGMALGVLGDRLTVQTAPAIVAELPVMPPASESKPAGEG